MEHRQTRRIKSISEFHRLRGLSQPEHPLISIVNYAEIQRPADICETNWIFNFYQISIKRGMNAKFRYGQQEYDFEDGVAFFTSPNQVFRIEPVPNPTIERSGWILLIHPDFLWNTTLIKTITHYAFFGYSVNEALWLSEKEETTINSIIKNIRAELLSNIDKFSKQIIVSQIESLLSYSERFYNRQFITREKSNHQILERLEKVLADYFDNSELMLNGLPTVEFIAGTLNISAKYLGSLLKALTGQSTQQHIHDKLIEKAKEKLSTTNLTISEIAYELGFEHPQSFSKLFKAKAKLSPLKFRTSFK
ncbi:helix-turn-helix domain-containing protein [Pedobacter sp. KLB.chiD]|uniref:helix-turn-helix domain-containing protein n=1 Tax=Pedobacter sp. KLB.chiD TaxID=3387402 RepID=UPI00399B9994